jgi:oligosaccharide repeat unit polymerase
MINMFGLYFGLNTVLPFGYAFFFLYGDQVDLESEIFLVLTIAFLFISIGLIFGNTFAKKFKPITLRGNPSSIRILLVCIPFIILGGYYFHSTKAYLALFEAINGNVLEAVRIRTSSTNALTRHSALYSMPFIHIFPSLALLAFLELIKNNQTRLSKNNLFLVFLVVIFVSFSVAYSVMLIQKYYLVVLGLYFLIGYCIYKNKNISYVKLSLLFAISVFAIAMLWAFYNRTPLDELKHSPLWVLNRIFYANLNGLNHYIEYYKNNPMIFGQSFPNTLNLLPYEPISITKKISYEYIMTRKQIMYGHVGSHPTIFLGEMLVNFGYIGCIFSSILLGFILGLLNKILDFVVNKPSHASGFFIVVYTVLTVNCFQVSTGSIFSFIHYIFVFNEMLLVTVTVLLLSSKLYFRKPSNTIFDSYILRKI